MNFENVEMEIMKLLLYYVELIKNKCENGIARCTNNIRGYESTQSLIKSVSNISARPDFLKISLLFIVTVFF